MVCIEKYRLPRWEKGRYRISNPPEVKPKTADCGRGHEYARNNFLQNDYRSTRSRRRPPYAWTLARTHHAARQPVRRGRADQALRVPGLFRHRPEAHAGDRLSSAFRDRDGDRGPRGTDFL